MKTEIRLATIRHIDELLPMVSAFHAGEGVEQDAETCRVAVASILMAPDLGYVWLIHAGDVLAGYIAVCLGYSIEFGGKDGFVDEFFLQEEYRGKGIGRAVLEMVIEQLRNDDIKALHLEVARTNSRAQGLYSSVGFELREKYHLMSCAL
jgi:ribosomal protein S18 acetylase RimI-like enzyme